MIRRVKVRTDYEQRITARAWLRANGYHEVADSIDALMAKWEAEGKGTRRNWWRVLAGDKQGKPRIIDGVEFPVIAVIQRRQGKPVASHAKDHNDSLPSTIVPPGGRWKNYRGDT